MDIAIRLDPNETQSGAAEPTSEIRNVIKQIVIRENIDRWTAARRRSENGAIMVARPGNRGAELLALRVRVIARIRQSRVDTAQNFGRDPEPIPHKTLVERREARN